MFFMRAGGVNQNFIAANINPQNNVSGSTWLGETDLAQPR